jgi:hypothetical protein
MRQFSRSLIFLLLCAPLFLSCGGGGSSSVEQPPPPVAVSRIDQLWDDIIVSYLQDDLWTSVNNYDAAHVLMFPMHWAFSKASERYRNPFDDYFERYTTDGSLADETNNLRKLQYLYLHSQYLSLVAQTEQNFAPWQQTLLEELKTEVEYQWNDYPAWNYGGVTFSGGMKERLEDKLSGRNFTPEYSRAIFDEEFFLMAIAADLMAILPEDADATLMDIQAKTYELFVNQSVFIGDGWLFQPGVWSHHRDYTHSGHDQVLPDLAPSIIDDIATDSSHFHRMPLWLESFQFSYELGRSERDFFENLVARTRYQFEEVIFVSPDPQFDGPRLVNFTDGRNGVYRYNYDTVAEGSGYGPYELSAVSLPLGWYVFLNSDALASAYAGIDFPMSSDLIDLYVGPNTTRERHPLVKWPDYFTNGFAELHVELYSSN